jgi:SAM-dependent methyltransferase
VSDESAREALLYDWHNRHRLRAQMADVPYWQAVVPVRSRVLVLGAGTGRVARPLAEQGRRVTALDASLARLRRIPGGSLLRSVCGDFRALPFERCFDAAIFPYSSFQLLVSARDRRRALTQAARVLIPGGMLHIDVSGSFDERAAADWALALAAPCDGAEMEEWERTAQAGDHVVIDKSFRSRGEVLVEVRERWAHLRSLDLETEMAAAGFEPTGASRGYGPGTAAHRLVHHGRRHMEEGG